MKLRSGVAPEGRFVVGIHRPTYDVRNLRTGGNISVLGQSDQGDVLTNQANFPEEGILTIEGDRVYEIPNAFPFRGTTYISGYHADAGARRPEGIQLPRAPSASMTRRIRQWIDDGTVSEAGARRVIEELPRPLKLALAATSTDAEDLEVLARGSAVFEVDSRTGRPTGMRYGHDEGQRLRPVIHDHELFELLANNPYLPVEYREAMVLRPGAQGDSPIVGDHHDSAHHSTVYEYLRANSYIPWGHYAANMADSSVRYRADDLVPADMAGMRHLYYQRTVVRLASMLGIEGLPTRRCLDADALDALRRQVLDIIGSGRYSKPLAFNRTLWGWNYGFDYSPTGYRLHASHQQVHQQYALLPSEAGLCCSDGVEKRRFPAYGVGDLVGDFIAEYQRLTGRPFFSCYIEALRHNRRTDGADRGPRSLIVYEDDRVILFVPKAQTSQWELQLMPLSPVGNVLEADTRMRASLDQAMVLAIRLLGVMGVRMVTTIEFPKPFDALDSDQHLLYAFLPRLPQSPGAFSEAQLRWINRHYPEDFAAACRRSLSSVR